MSKHDETSKTTFWQKFDNLKMRALLHFLLGDFLRLWPTSSTSKHIKSTSYQPEIACIAFRVVLSACRYRKHLLCSFRSLLAGAWNEQKSKTGENESARRGLRSVACGSIITLVIVEVKKSRLNHFQMRFEAAQSAHLLDWVANQSPVTMSKRLLRAKPRCSLAVGQSIAVY